MALFSRTATAEDKQHRGHIWNGTKICANFSNMPQVIYIHEDDAVLAQTCSRNRAVPCSREKTRGSMRRKACPVPSTWNWRNVMSSVTASCTSVCVADASSWVMVARASRRQLPNFTPASNEATRNFSCSSSGSVLSATLSRLDNKTVEWSVVSTTMLNGILYSERVCPCCMESYVCTHRHGRYADKEQLDCPQSCDERPKCGLCCVTMDTPRKVLILCVHLDVSSEANILVIPGRLPRQQMMCAAPKPQRRLGQHPSVQHIAECSLRGLRGSMREGGGGRGGGGGGSSRTVQLSIWQAKRVRPS